MKNDLNIHQVLSVYQSIVTHGRENNGRHSLNGIEADSGFDGYTVTLSDDKVCLTLHFHNHYDLNSPNRYAEQAFFEKLTQIEKQYRRPQNP